MQLLLEIWGVECNDFETYSDGVFPTTLQTTSSFSFTSDNTGSGWLFIANDSGYEGINSILSY